MGSNQIDFYISVRFLFILSRIWGCIGFRAEGPVGNRKILMKKTDLIFFVGQYILFLFLFYHSIISYINKSVKLGMERYPQFAVAFSHLLMFTGIFIVQISSHKEYAFLYKGVERMCSELQSHGIKVNFRNVQKFCKYTFLVKSLILFLLICDFFIVYKDNFFEHIHFLFHLYCEFGENLITVQTSVMLFGGMLLMCKINMLLRRSHRVDRRSLQKLMDFHGELRELCLRGNNLFSFLVVKLFSIFASFVYFMFKFAVNFDQLEYFWVYHTVVWNLHNFSSVLMIILACVAARKEVRNAKWYLLHRVNSFRADITNKLFFLTRRFRSLKHRESLFALYFQH